MTDEEKAKKFEKLTNKINKKFQNGSKAGVPIVKSLTPDELELSFIPTNAEALNEALGGGFPRSCIITLHGDAGAGKTSLALSVAQEVQEQGGRVLFINTEGTFGVAAKATGLDVSKLNYVEPQDYAEQLIDVIDGYAFDEEERTPTGIIDCIILDSINALIPKQDVDKLDKDGAEGMNMATKARVLNDLLGRFKGRNYLKHGGMLILIAQDRANISGNSRVTSIMSGGKAIRYYSDVIVKLSKAPLYRVEKSKNVEYGHTVSFAVEKNKGTGFQKKGEYTVIQGAGIDDSDKLVLDAQEWGYLVKDKKDFILILPDGDVKLEGGIAKVRERMKTDSLLKDEFKKVWRQGKPKIAPSTTGMFHPAFTVVVVDDLDEEIDNE